MPKSLCLAIGCALWLLTAVLAQDRGPTLPVTHCAEAHATLPQFQTSDNCLACHNGLTAASGEDVSIGTSWRASMMANSSRDPYWQASVRRETLDHPSKKAEIEDECAICHMPMPTALARWAGGHGRIFDYLPVGQRDEEEDRLAADGVSCTLCHQISPERLGTPESLLAASS
jgi:hypothetical protein